MCPGLSQCVEAFDVIMNGPVSDYLNYSRAIGSEVEKHVSCVGFIHQKLMLTCINPLDRREKFSKMLIDPQVTFTYYCAL